MTTRPTATILDRIVADKQEEVYRRRREVPLPVLEEAITGMPVPRDFAAALRRTSLAVIAEIKKASPSKGVLREGLNPLAFARIYADAGAAAISVLTEERHFLGTMGSLAIIRHTLDRERGNGNGAVPPLLRKDFLFDPYQIYEARAYGADAVLLIAAILEQEQLAELIALTHDLGMAALVEVHDESELMLALSAGAQVIGINNRDLRTFHTDLAVTERLVPQIPAGKTIVSESGIHTRDDALRMQASGVHALLIGESLVTAKNPAAKLRDFVL